MKHSKTLQRIVELNPNYLESYYCDSDGHWMHTQSRFIFPDMECGTLHEDNVKAMLDMIRGGVETADYIDGSSTKQSNPVHIKLRVS